LYNSPTAELGFCQGEVNQPAAATAAAASKLDSNWLTIFYSPSRDAFLFFVVEPLLPF
jgi:hypothetical protein